MAMQTHSGPLIPPWYKDDTVAAGDMNAISIFWGFSLCLACFTAAKAAKQTWRSWQRNRRLPAYVAMIWGHWLTNVVLSIVTWLHFWGAISTSFWLLCFTVFAWSIQVHLLMQIIINRICLLIHDRSLTRRLKWGAFIVVFILTIVVCVIWIPSSLQISPAWTEANRVWDRTKQALLLVMDLALNIYFLYVVRKHLILNGLTKYTMLFRLNILMVGIVTALDVALIGLMSLPVTTAYLQFQEVAYLAKLYIELNNTELITRVAKASNELNFIHGTSPSAPRAAVDNSALRHTIFSSIPLDADHRHGSQNFTASVKLGGQHFNAIVDDAVSQSSNGAIRKL